MGHTGCKCNKHVRVHFKNSPLSEFHLCTLLLLTTNCSFQILLFCIVKQPHFCYIFIIEFVLRQKFVTGLLTVTVI